MLVWKTILYVDCMLFQFLRSQLDRTRRNTSSFFHSAGKTLRLKERFIRFLSILFYIILQIILQYLALNNSSNVHELTATDTCSGVSEDRLRDVLEKSLLLLCSFLLCQSGNVLNVYMHMSPIKTLLGIDHPLSVSWAVNQLEPFVHSPFSHISWGRLSWH